MSYLTDFNVSVFILKASTRLQSSTEWEAKLGILLPGMLLGIVHFAEVITWDTVLTNKPWFLWELFCGNSVTVQVLGEAGETICNWSAWQHIASTFLGEMHWALKRDNRRSFSEISRASLGTWLELCRGNKFQGSFLLMSHFATLQNPL